MARDARDKFGEYSGRPGSIHTAADGHEDLSAAEQRRIDATYGIRTPEVETDDPDAVFVNTGIDVDGSKWEDAEQRMRAIRVAEARKRVGDRGVGG